MSIRSWLVVLLALLPAPLWGQGITIPNTFVNGTAADATQVNANFSSLANNALNRTGGTMSGTLNTLLVQPTVTNTSDVGASGFMYRTGYVRTSLVLGQTAGNYTLTWANPAAARAISFEDPGGTDILVYKAATQTLANKTLTAPVLTGSTTAAILTLSGVLTVNGGYTQFTGASGSPSSGKGIEIRGTATPSITAIDRDSGPTYLPFSSDGISHSWAINGTARMALSSTAVLSVTANNSGTVVSGNFNALQAVNTVGHQWAFNGGAAGATQRGGLGYTHTGSGTATFWATEPADSFVVYGVSGGVSIGTSSGGTPTMHIPQAATGVALGGVALTDALATPTISSGCGTGPSIDGKASFFKVVVGTGSPTTCIVNFNATLGATASACSVDRDTLDGFMRVTSTTAQVSASSTTAFTSGEVLSFLCRGY